ncbi:MAG: 2-oxoacid:acceptor oxidoreductase subunit alpha [Bacillota bacterium]|nr:2-oxoacid:acceptor oxidoreductase subunit alpha [Bacillota bacterium]MDW7678203.1 2-oxoacid:acceptor oxidoreductase subunit alpha [Bacillota bacterium]
MLWQKTILIGGIQGEGVASTGINLMKSLSGIGYYTFGERKFSSRIKGGNTHILITISNEPVYCVSTEIDIILAFDTETVQLNVSRLSDQGLLLVDEVVELPEDLLEAGRVVALPLTSLAKKHGSLLMKNTCAIGFIWKMLRLDASVLEESTEKTYFKKGEDVIQQNLQVFRAAFDVQQPDWDGIEGLPRADDREAELMLMTGNDAITLGALMAGCRFMAAYPITPASDVMEMMSRELPAENGMMIQTEDEIAAVTMCIGASYAGVRSLTATSGPGLTLMMEGLGLAGMIETPLVVVDAQRAGPSTGMPTRTEQSDLASLYYAGHGEFPMIILSPSSIEECYELTLEAFQLADHYQCPVILLSDLNLSLSPQTIKALRYAPPTINRGETDSEESLKSDVEQTFPRYALTASGISPRTFPGTIGGIHQVTGLEHTVLGRPSDNPKNRQEMMDKRLRKTAPLRDQNAIHVKENSGKILCLTFGSSWGVLQEAVQNEGLRIDIAHISRIRPLPERQLKQLLEGYTKVIVMEHNQQGQLAGILRGELGFSDNLVSLTRYDGESFKVSEVRDKLKRWCDEWK